ncbi:MAG: aspartate kinase, partial [Asticcacaulis sp.]
MTRLVMKFGGTSMADLERIRRAARLVASEVDAGHKVAVVVSAMAGKTNELVAWADGAGQPTGRAAEISSHSDDEYDVIVASGEQVTAGLLAMTLRNLGYPARSMMGWQVPIRTSMVHAKARIADFPADNLIEALDSGQIVIVPGFQGVNDEGRITTLGRGGSDTSAVAVAIAAEAIRCDIYTDVDGVYTTDPRIEAKAKRLNKVSFEEMLEMASLGAKVLQTRSVELAMAYRMPVRVLSSFVEPGDNKANDNLGTLVCDEEEIVEKHIVSGVAYSRDEAKITLLGLPNKIGVSAAVFSKLAAADINVDMIVQSEKRTGDYANQLFTVSRREAQRAAAIMNDAKAEIGFDALMVDEGVSKISIVGVGMRSHTGVAETMFRALSD